jgi:hypothetical protein
VRHLSWCDADGGEPRISSIHHSQTAIQYTAFNTSPAVPSNQRRAAANPVMRYPIVKADYRGVTPRMRATSLGSVMADMVCRCSRAGGSPVFRGVLRWIRKTVTLLQPLSMVVVQKAAIIKGAIRPLIGCSRPLPNYKGTPIGANQNCPNCSTILMDG